MNPQIRRILLAIEMWRDGFSPSWATEQEIVQLEKDYAQMQKRYKEEGGWEEGWLAAHSWLIETVFAQANRTRK